MAKKMAYEQAQRNEYVSSVMKKYGIKTNFAEKITYEFMTDESNL